MIRRGVTIPSSVLWSLIFAAAGIAVTYIFATKLELAGVAQAASTRITVVEETVKHHDEALSEIKQRTESLDDNVRTMMIQQGIPSNKIKGAKR